jgi:hypothetical protein
MQLFNCTHLLRTPVLLLWATVLLFACNPPPEESNAGEDETILFTPENFLHPDTVMDIRKKILATTLLTNTVQTEDGLSINLPLFYDYESSVADITLPFFKENGDTSGDDTDDDTVSAPGQDEAKLRAYELIPTFADKYSFEEKVVIADTNIKNEDILTYFKENSYDRIDKLIYEDATSYIGVGSFNSIIVLCFSPDTVTGNRFFYYAKCKPEGLSKKETVRFAFQLAQHGYQFLHKGNAAPAPATDFSNQLNEVEYKSLDKVLHSLKKEAEVFLGDKDYISYKLLPQAATLYLLPDALSAQLAAYTNSLPFNQPTPVTTLAELCDAVDMNFINFWRQESLVRITAAPLNTDKVIVLEVTPSSNWDSEKRYHLLAPVVKNNKNFLLWLEIRDNQVDAFEKAAYLQLIHWIQSKI